MCESCSYNVWQKGRGGCLAVCVWLCLGVGVDVQLCMGVWLVCMSVCSCTLNLSCSTWMPLRAMYANLQDQTPHTSVLGMLILACLVGHAMLFDTPLYDE